MGNEFCCSETDCKVPTVKVCYVPHKIRKGQTKIQEEKERDFLNSRDSFASPSKSANFKKFMEEREQGISSIQKLEDPEFSTNGKQHLKDLFQTKNQGSLLIPTSKQSVVCPNAANWNRKWKMSEEKMMEHSKKCPICFEIIETLMTMKTDTGTDEDLPQEEIRASMPEHVREKPDKQETLTEMFYTPEEMEEALTTKNIIDKYSDPNKYQLKCLKYRKTSHYQPEVR